MRERPLRLCVVGDIAGPHTRRWVRCFAGRDDFDLHLISFYPVAPLEGATLHILCTSQRWHSPGTGRGQHPPPRFQAALRRSYERLPRWGQHLLNAFRYRHHGLARVIHTLRPDILHSHFLVEHGFFAATVGYRPHVVTAWGSDVLVMAAHSPIERAIVRYTLRHADLAIANNAYLTRCTQALAPPHLRVVTITLGIDRFFLDGYSRSVNVVERPAPPTIISTRSLDSPLYRLDDVIRAFALARTQVPDARLLIAGEGRLRPGLEQLAAGLGLGDNVRFLGFVPHERLLEVLPDAQVYVSVPGSDATALSTLEAMACGCFPVVSDLPSQDEWIVHGETGYRVPVGDILALAHQLIAALKQESLRRSAAPRNRALVEAKGLLEPNMRMLEAWYRRLVRR